MFFGRARTLLYLLCKFDGVKSSNLLSRPTRGAWIEILWIEDPYDQSRSRAPHGARGLKYLPTRNPEIMASRAPHGARGLKFTVKHGLISTIGRAPHGARGLKFDIVRSELDTGLSRPTRGAWIEICRNQGEHGGCNGRTPHGVRGLKFDHRAGLLFPNRRAPRRTPPTADAPDCKCSPGRSYKRKACSAERTRSEARGHRRATGEEVP